MAAVSEKILAPRRSVTAPAELLSKVASLEGGSRPGNRSSLFALQRAKTRDLAAALAEADDQSPEEMHENHNTYPIALVVFTIVIGVVCGAATAFFHTIIALSGCALSINGCSSYSKFAGIDGYLLRETDLSIYVWSIICCTSAGLIVGVFYAMVPKKILAHIKGGGTTEALIATARGDVIPVFPQGLCRMVITALYLGAGHSLGGEGPTIHLCTSISTTVGQICGLRTPKLMSILCVLGMTAGLAAAFNCPVAAIVYAMEDLGPLTGSLSRPLIGLMSVGSVFATLTLRLGFHDHQMVHLNLKTANMADPEFQILSLLFGGAIGLICGATGKLLSSSLLWLRAKFKRLTRPAKNGEDGARSESEETRSSSSSTDQSISEEQDPISRSASNNSKSDRENNNIKQQDSSSRSGTESGSSSGKKTGKISINVTSCAATENSSSTAVDHLPKLPSHAGGGNSTTRAFHTLLTSATEMKTALKCRFVCPPSPIKEGSRENSTVTGSVRDKHSVFEYYDKKLARRRSSRNNSLVIHLGTSPGQHPSEARTSPTASPQEHVSVLPPGTPTHHFQPGHNEDQITTRDAGFVQQEPHQQLPDLWPPLHSAGHYNLTCEKSGCLSLPPSEDDRHCTRGMSASSAVNILGSVPESVTSSCEEQPQYEDHAAHQEMKGVSHFHQASREQQSPGKEPRRPDSAQSNDRKGQLGSSSSSSSSSVMIVNTPPGGLPANKSTQAVRFSPDEGQENNYPSPDTTVGNKSNLGNEELLAKSPGKTSSGRRAGELNSRLGKTIDWRPEKEAKWLVFAFTTTSFLTAAIGCFSYYTTGLKGTWGIGTASLQRFFDFHAEECDLSAGECEYHKLEPRPGRTSDFLTGLIFALCKMTCFVLCVAVGGPGGILMPSLIVGGFLGGTTLAVFQLVLPTAMYTRLWQPCVAFGVIGLFSANFRFPLTSVVILFELTGFNTGMWHIALGCILASYIAIAVSDGFFKFPSLFDALCQQDDISLFRMRWDMARKPIQLTITQEDGPEEETDFEQLDSLIIQQTSGSHARRRSRGSGRFVNRENEDDSTNSSQRSPSITSSSEQRNNLTHARSTSSALSSRAGRIRKESSTGSVISVLNPFHREASMQSVSSSKNSTSGYAGSRENSDMHRRKQSRLAAEMMGIMLSGSATNKLSPRDTQRTTSGDSSNRVQGMTVQTLQLDRVPSYERHLRQSTQGSSSQGSTTQNSSNFSRMENSKRGASM
ncbi:unnamed protein product [Amoebophrya sp. A120]|nr:unnamed protein product [Amoebophrya sp. A120]|eukprot:GSA120T00012771001.1